jgi:hypothetical protein
MEFCSLNTEFACYSLHCSLHFTKAALLPGGTVILFVAPYTACLWIIEFEKAGFENEGPSECNEFSCLFHLHVNVIKRWTLFVLKYACSQLQHALRFEKPSQGQPLGQGAHNCCPGFQKKRWCLNNHQERVFFNCSCYKAINSRTQKNFYTFWYFKVFAYYHISFITSDLHSIQSDIPVVLCADNKYPKHADAFGGLPEPGTSLSYTFKGQTPCVAKYHCLTAQDPLPYSLLEELYLRHLSEYDLGILFTLKKCTILPLVSPSVHPHCTIYSYS